MHKISKVVALKKFVFSPASIKLLFFEAVFWSLYYRIITRVLPFRIWIKGVENQKIQPSKIDNEIVKNLFRAMRRSSTYLPFKEKCLIEALVMKKMLYKRNISSILSLGLSKDERKSNLLAHAWLSCNGEIITGKKNAGQFVEIKRY